MANTESDSGLASNLLNIDTTEELSNCYALGKLFENNRLNKVDFKINIR